MLRTPERHPHPENATLEELRVAMDAAPNKRSYVRLNAIRSLLTLLMGIPRATLCEQFCRTDRRLRLWIELFNRGGIDALITKARPGRRRKVKLETRARSFGSGAGKSSPGGPGAWDRSQTPPI